MVERKQISADVISLAWERGDLERKLRFHFERAARNESLAECVMSFYDRK